MKLGEKSISALVDVITGNKQASPYRSGPELVQFFNQFGSNDVYGEVNFPSRGKFTLAKLNNANGLPQMADIIKAVFDPRNFMDTDFQVKEVVDSFNAFFAYDGYELFEDGLHYHIRTLRYHDGVNGFVKNLIFAPIGPKPEIVLDNATTNDIRIVKNAEYCLVYDKGFSEEGLFWEDLVEWWSEFQGLEGLSRSNQRRDLYRRLVESIGTNDPEKLLFETYFKSFFATYQERLPALVPQVYLHYDPYTARQLNNKKRVARERMDFLLFLPHRKYIVIEIDGKQHYSQDDRAVPKLYADMVAEDRKLKLRGYDIYRFGGYEFIDASRAKQKIKKFFEDLFALHSIAEKIR